jgi:hypothetical protein
MSDSPDASAVDYYARLGVHPSASAEEIRSAYREKARATHPDHNPDDPKAADRFQKVKQAYHVLRDADRRATYDHARTRSQTPDVLHVAQQAPAGCGGYVWRVFAGVAAVGVFIVLEALGVWNKDVWTLTVAVGGGALVAGLLTVLVARRYPDAATDVALRLDSQHLHLRADGQIVARIAWAQVAEVQFRPQSGQLLLRATPTAVGAARGLHPVPPVLTEVDRRRTEVLLRFDLSDTDVPARALVAFLRTTDSIPFPAPHA